MYTIYYLYNCISQYTISTSSFRPCRTACSSDQKVSLRYYIGGVHKDMWHYHLLNLQIERKDLLELMLKAEIKDSEGKQVSKLSEDEVVAQSFVFLLAGYETTSNTLSYVTYCLALNPEVQEKLIKEIDDAVGDNVSAKSEGKVKGDKLSEIRE